MDWTLTARLLHGLIGPTQRSEIVAGQMARVQHIDTMATTTRQQSWYAVFPNIVMTGPGRHGTSGVRSERGERDGY